MKAVTVALLIFFAVACTDNVVDVTPCSLPDQIHYFTDVYPIIDRTCAIPTCHVNGFQFGNFKNADEVKKVANNGKLDFMIVTRQMPAGFTNGPTYLADCEINMIRTWIKNGATLN
jgi:hypothetical protein